MLTWCLSVDWVVGAEKGRFKDPFEGMRVFLSDVRVSVAEHGMAWHGDGVRPWEIGGPMDKCMHGDCALQVNKE